MRKCLRDSRYSGCIHVQCKIMNNNHECLYTRTRYKNEIKALKLAYKYKWTILILLQSLHTNMTIKEKNCLLKWGKAQENAKVKVRRKAFFHASVHFKRPPLSYFDTNFAKTFVLKPGFHERSPFDFQGEFYLRVMDYDYKRSKNTYSLYVMK